MRMQFFLNEWSQPIVGKADCIALLHDRAGTLA